MSAGPGRTPPAPRRRLHAPEAQAVTFGELFFDLVFVFAVTQVTSLTAVNLTASGIARSLLLFWLIWWAWTQFTWTLTPRTRTTTRCGSTSSATQNTAPCSSGSQCR